MPGNKVTIYKSWVLYGALFITAFTVFRISYVLGNHVRLRPNPEDHSLPITELPDILFSRYQSGNPIRLHALKGLPTLVLTADTRVEHQVSTLVSNATLRTQQPHNTIIITNNPARVRGVLTKTDTIMFADGKEFSRLLKVFHLAGGLPAWLLFDSKGLLRGRGRYDSDALPYFLRTVVDHDGEFTAAFLKQIARTSLPAETVHALRDRVQKQRPVAALLLAKVDSGCPEFSMIRALKQSSLTVTVLLLGKLGVSDGETLCHNFQLPFDYFRPTEATQLWWRDLITQYGLAAVNGSVVIVNDQGIVGAAVHVSDLASKELLLEN